MVDLETAESSEIEADEVERIETSTSTSLLTQIFQRSTECWGAVPSCTNPLADEDLEVLVESLLKDLQGGNKLKSAALLRLYRIPMVCTTKYNVVTSVLPCLSGSSQDRRQALLLLGNLFIPAENKATILLGDTARLLLPVLLRLIRQRQAEAYLAAVCLFNLSFLDSGKQFLMDYVAPDDAETVPTEYKHYVQPRDNPRSLISTLESVLWEYLPFVQNRPTTLSVQVELVHWSMATLRNLVVVDPNYVFQRTRIVTVALSALQDPQDLSLWKRDSLEDSSLVLLVQLAHAGCLNNSQELQGTLTQLLGKGGIHESRARAILDSLEEKKEEERALKQVLSV